MARELITGRVRLRVVEAHGTGPRVHVGTSGYNYPEWKGTSIPPTCRRLGCSSTPRRASASWRSTRRSTACRRPDSGRVGRVHTGGLRVRPEGAATDHALGRPAQRRRARALLLRHGAHPRGQAGTAALPATAQLPQRSGPAGRPAGPPAPDLACAFEFRHDSWLADDVYERLRGRNAALCIADSERGTTPLVATADFGYLRLRDEGYDDAGLASWVETIHRRGPAGATRTCSSSTRPRGRVRPSPSDSRPC